MKEPERLHLLSVKSPQKGPEHKSCLGAGTRQRADIKFMLLLTYGKYPKVQLFRVRAQTSLLVPTSVFLSAEANIYQKEMAFTSCDRIMEPTDTENVEYFIYLDLHKAFDFASQDTSKNKQIHSR